MYNKLFLKLPTFKAVPQNNLDGNHDGCRKFIEIININHELEII